MRSKPYQANSTLAMLSKFFGWAEKHGLRPDGSNPCRHVEKYPEGRRERFLSQAELGRLGDALRQAEQDKAVPRGQSPRFACSHLRAHGETKSSPCDGSTSARSMNAFCFPIPRRDERRFL